MNEAKNNENRENAKMTQPSQGSLLGGASSQDAETSPIEPGEEEMMTIPVAEYEKLVGELEENKGKYLRLLAEFDNARKRYEREKNEFVKYANEGLIIDFLSIMDDLERTMHAAKASHENYKAFLKGVEMVMNHIHELLRKNNVKPIAAVGKKFDPHSHEILVQEPHPEAEEGTVIEELQKGYMLGDRVVRTAKVKVAVKPENTGTGS